MKSKRNISKIKDCSARAGENRKKALERGDIWIKPTMCMETRSKYNRKRSKGELRKMIEIM